jgi:hypothetical protein
VLIASKALDRLFHLVADEEHRIRTNVAARPMSLPDQLSSQIGAAVLAAAAGAAAAVSFSAATDVIYACMKDGAGTIQIVSAGQVCRSGETLLSWNVLGPAGPQGLHGL